MAAKRVTSLLQPAPERVEIVNLSIEREHITAIGGVHGLVPFGAEVQNRQAAMAEGQPCAGIGPQAFIIRPAVAQSRRHSEDDLLQLDAVDIASRVPKSGDSTHNCFTAIAAPRSCPHTAGAFSRRPTSSRV